MTETKNALFEGLESLVSNGVPGTTETVATDETKTATANSQETKEDVGFTLEEIEAFTKAPKEDVVQDTTKDLIKEVKEKGTKEENKTEDKTAEEETGDEDNSANVYKAVSDIFKEEGFIDSDFDSAEKMVEVFSKRIEEEVNDYKEALPQVIKDLINNYEEGVPLMDLIKVKSEQIKYSNIDEESLETNEDLQKAIVKDYLKNTTRYSEDKINKEIKKLAEAGELFDEAKSNKKELVQLQKDAEKALEIETKKAQEAQRLEDQKTLKEVRKTISSVKEIIPGIRVTEKENDELFKLVTTPVELVGNEPVSYLMKIRQANPVKFDMTVAYLAKKGIFEDKWDVIMAKAETKAANKLEKQLDEAAKKMQNQGGKSAPIPETDKSKSTFKGLEEAIGMRKRANERN